MSAEHTTRERAETVKSELEAARDEIRNARGVLLQACSRVVCDVGGAAACLQGVAQSLRHLDQHLDNALRAAGES